MDYEKKYKEALAKCKAYIDDTQKRWSEEFCKATEEVFFEIFPELKEPEGEKIRKAQLDYWRSVGGKEWHGVPVQKVIAWLEKQGEKLQVDGFDAELNALLKKYEYLSKKELQEPLEFYLGVVRDDLDVVREEGKPKWTEEDSLMIDSIVDTIKWLEGKGATNMKIDWLKSLKQRMEE